MDPEHVWEEYPRPMMKRDSYVNLNGIWKYAITRGNRIPKEYVVGMRRNKFGVDVLIRSKEKFAQRFPEIFMDAASIEEILLFEARGEKI